MIPFRRRGACPSLSSPMQTGDGLLARLMLSGQTISLDAAAALCAAARRHGSGIIEVTSRGSVQVRGLTRASVPAFVSAISGVGIPVPEGLPIAVNPLAGLAPDEAVDGVALADALRDAIRATGLRRRLAAKVAVAIDDGSALHLDALPADLRLRAGEAGPEGAHVHLAVGGPADSAAPVGTVALDHAVDAALRILGELAARGEAARARDVVRVNGVAPFRAAVADLLLDDAPAGGTAAPVAADTLPLRPRSAPLGVHALRDGTVALGVGLPFGHIEADALLRLIAAAQRIGATGLRAAPDRALLLLGIPPDAAADLADEVAAFGFITCTNDPRRAMAVCPGAPFCACTDVPMRTLAPEIARAAPALFDGSLMVHFSGCAKGCAFQGNAGLTVVGGDGRCAVIVNGTPRDGPVVTLAPDTVAARFALLAQACVDEGQPGEATAAVLARLGAARISAILSGATA